MSEQQFQRVAKALADARRFAIYERIAATPELACQRMSQCFPVSQATVSHHLKELAGAGLVESRREGQFVFYRAMPETLDGYLTELRRRIPAAGQAPTLERGRGVPPRGIRIAKHGANA